MANIYQLPKGEPLQDALREPTEMLASLISATALQEEKYGELATTLTTHEPSIHIETTSQLQLSGPINVDELIRASGVQIDDASTSPNSLSASLSNIRALNVGMAPKMMQLRIELEEHSKDLKREFEEKTGRSWTPLRPWASEEWGWDDDIGSEDLLGWLKE